MQCQANTRAAAPPSSFNCDLHMSAYVYPCYVLIYGYTDDRYFQSRGWHNQVSTTTHIKRIKLKTNFSRGKLCNNPFYVLPLCTYGAFLYVRFRSLSISNKFWFSSLLHSIFLPHQCSNIFLPHCQGSLGALWGMSWVRSQVLTYQRL